MGRGQLSGPALAAHIVRKVPPAPEMSAEVQAVAERLLAVSDVVPDDTNVILGGSLARGEPTFVRDDAGHYRLESDLDLLLVHESVLPPMSAQRFLDLTHPTLPTMTIMMASADEYRRLGTSLGFEFKNLGVSLNQPALPEHEPVVLDARDAYEIVLFCIQIYLWSGIVPRWLAGEDSTGFHLVVNRLCIKVIRACGMLLGSYNHSDLAELPDELRESMRTELAWRREPSTPPLPAARFWPTLHTVLGYFDRAFGRARPDAVTDTRYESCDGAAVVARHHQIAHALARAVLESVGATEPAPHAVREAQRDAWTRLVQAGMARPAYDPEEHFAARIELIRDSLYSMKVSEPGSESRALSPPLHVDARRRRTAGSASGRSMS